MCGLQCGFKGTSSKSAAALIDLKEIRSKFGLPGASSASKTLLEHHEHLFFCLLQRYFCFPIRCPDIFCCSQWRGLYCALLPASRSLASRAASGSIRDLNRFPAGGRITCNIFFLSSPDFDLAEICSRDIDRV